MERKREKEKEGRKDFHSEEEEERQISDDALREMESRNKRTIRKTRV